MVKATRSIGGGKVTMEGDPKYNIRLIINVDSESYKAFQKIFSQVHETEEDALDTIIFRTEMIMPSDELRVRVRPLVNNASSLSSASPEWREVPLVPNTDASMKFSFSVPVSLWAGQDGFCFNWGSEIVYFNLAPQDAPPESWGPFRERMNRRNLAAGYAHPFAPLLLCPECGTPFKPDRKDQVYDKRSCANRAGERRRRQERTPSCVLIPM